MSIDNTIPGFTEIDDWPFVIKLPIRIKSHGAYRDSGGPQAPTYYVDLEDGSGKVIPFFFEKFLGRLCYGSTYETGNDAAFIKLGSKLEREAFEYIDLLARSDSEFKDILKKLDHAKVWSKL